MSMQSEAYLDFQPRGAARDLFTRHDPEVILSGPAGTGKSRSALEKLHLCALKYDGMRGLIVRKTRASLTQTAMVTFEHQVLHPSDGVRFHTTSQEYQYPNGSRIVVGGLDKPIKVMSAEYDVAYVQEATEVTEHDFESLTTRLRNGVIPYQQVIGDCNPDAPTHWLKRRADRGQTVMLESRHEDNPRLWRDGDWTADGRAYIAKLDALTGARLQRLRHGRWVAAEGIVYEGFDRTIHLLDRFEIPRTWQRIRAIDFGYTNPFVCQWWALDHDHRMYLYREIYMTGRLVSDHAKLIKKLSTGEPCAATVADHDAEDRATLRAGAVPTIPAKKEIRLGLEEVEDRLRRAGDGKPRLFLLRDSLVERDEQLVEAGRPLCTEHEFDSYVWPKAVDGRPIKETPVDLDNHGMDAMRYAAMHLQRRITGNRYAVSAPRPDLTQYHAR